LSFQPGNGIPASALIFSIFGREFRPTPGAVPEMKDIHDAGRFVAGVENQVGSQGHLSNAPPFVMKRVALRQIRQTHCPNDELFTEAFCRPRIVLRDKLDDFLEIV